MTAEALAMACCTDIAGQVRGKGFPLKDLEGRLRRGVGWVPTNFQITAFDRVAQSPFGPLGDLLLIPDQQAEVRVKVAEEAPPLHFFLGDIRETNGEPWSCCLRSALRQALQRLKLACGAEIFCAFETEFQFADGGSPFGSAFSLQGFFEKLAFGEQLLGALREAGITPDSFLREFGADQYEVTVKPTRGLRAADEAVMVREIARALARCRNERITFTPLRSPGAVGNGVHVHLSLLDETGLPCTYDPQGPNGLSSLAGSFVAGILTKLPSIVAMTAPSVISYNRLTPHRWSAAFNNLGYRDRESAVRICPVVETEGHDIAGQFNVEFRAADATASPHLQLAALIHAGVYGIERKLGTPQATQQDLSRLDPGQLSSLGLKRLPGTLAAALDNLEGDDEVRSWFPKTLMDIFLMHKRSEIAHMTELEPAAVFSAYEQVY